MAVVGEHSLRDVTCDTHDGLIAVVRFGEFGDGVVPQVMEAEPLQTRSSRNLSPSCPPAFLRSTAVDMPALASWKDVVVRFGATEGLRTPVQAKERVHCIAIERDHSLSSLGLASTHRYHALG